VVLRELRRGADACGAAAFSAVAACALQRWFVIAVVMVLREEASSW